MDRIELIPKDVRGGGNITQSHDSMVTDEQVSIYRATLTRSGGVSDSFYLPYYRVVRKAGVNLLWNPPRVTSDNVVHVTVNFVYASNNLPVMYSEVILDLRDSDNEILWTASGTIMDGAVSFSIEIMDDFPSVCFWNVNVSHSTYGHVHDSRRMVLGSVTNFDAFATKSVIQTGETSYLIGTVTGLSSEGNVFGVPGQTVSVYEQWTPGLRVSAPIVQSGDTVDIKAQLIDTTDGSLVREAEHTVNVYWDDAPVPVPTTLYVDFDKTILSYADGDSAYVIVRVYDQFGNEIPNQSVSVSRSDGVSWTVETDMYGQGSFSYVSHGDGDVTFTFECGNLSESITIEDCKFYDASSSSNVNKYSVESGTSFSYDSSNSSYSLYPTSAGARWVTLNSYTFSKDNKVSIDFNITNAPTNAQYGFLIGNICCRAIKAGSIQRITISNNEASSDYTYYDHAISTQEWYTLELLPTGVLNLKQGETIIATCNYDISSIQGDTNNFKIYSAHSTNTSGNVRNIKIKPL